MTLVEILNDPKADLTLRLTLEEVIKQLATLSSVKVSVQGKGSCLNIPYIKYPDLS